MINLLNYIADEYFANKLGNKIIKSLCLFCLKKKFEIKNKLLNVYVNEKVVFSCSIEEAFYILANVEEFERLMKFIIEEVKTND